MLCLSDLYYFPGPEPGSGTPDDERTEAVQAASSVMGDAGQRPYRITFLHRYMVRSSDRCQMYGCGIFSVRVTVPSSDKKRSNPRFCFTYSIAFLASAIFSNNNFLLYQHHTGPRGVHFNVACGVEKRVEWQSD